MAFVIAAIRQRNKGAEIDVLNDVSGATFTLWRVGYGTNPDDSPAALRAWARAEIDARKAERDVVDAEKASEDTDLTAAGFKTWLAANISRADVREALRPVVRIFTTRP